VTFDHIFREVRLHQAGVASQHVDWTRLGGEHPWLAPALQWIHDKVDFPDVVRTATSALATWSGSVLRASFSGVANLLLTFYFLFYLLRDREQITESARLHLPMSEPEFSQLTRRVTDTIFATVFGTVAVAALQGGLGGLMFWWLGLPAPVFWGVLMAFLAIVPFLGAFVIWAPAAVFLALSGAYTSAIVLTIWGTLVVGLVDNVVYPILVGNKLRMHTMLSFIAVVVHRCCRRARFHRCTRRRVGSIAARGHPDLGATLAQSGSGLDRCTATTT
jgi:predicted PurR-regulated permease PerM